MLDASAAHTVEAQVQSLVEDVREVMGVGVCSLYQRYDDDVLRLVANRGLASGSVGSVELPVGEGLIGKIALSRVPVNVESAGDHPDFRYFPESGEDAYPAFLGVPIVHLGEVQGVLAVQDRKGRRFSADEESFLVTIAAQLAPVLLRFSSALVYPGAQREYRGVGAAPGKGLGRLHLVLSGQTLHLVDEPEPDEVGVEMALLAKATTQAMEDLDRAKAQLGGTVSADVLELFDVHRLLLANEQLRAGAERRILEGGSAFAAVRETVDEYVRAFEEIEDDYLRARSEDIRNVGNQLLGRLAGEVPLAAVPGEKVVLLGSTVSIADLGGFAREDLAGVVCFSGSSLSHTAVVARSLGIPAVFGTGPIDHIGNGVPTIVDGDLGRVIFSPTAPVQAEYRRLVSELKSFQDELLKQKSLPATSTDGVRVDMLANTGLLADASPGKEYGAEGIGLFRSEIPFLSGVAFPSEDEQYDTYRRMLRVYHPAPVTMRILDIGGDKPPPYLSIKEDNPALGWRGVRFALDNPAVLVTQLRAMLRADEGLGNLRVLVPMVSSVDEVMRVKQLIAERMEEVERSAPAPALGIMIEVPGAIALIEHLAEQVNFLSVGTNDLTQYLLAVDRSNGRVSSLYDYLHPAVLHALELILQRARQAQLDVTLCGEMASDPIGATLLFGLGFRSLSMTAFSIPRVKAVIRRLSHREAERIAVAACAMARPAEIRQLVHDELVAMGLADLLSVPKTQGS